MLNITKDDSKDLGFVMGCLFSQAITLDEFNLWVIHVIKITPMEKIPEYIFDLVGFNGYLSEICDIIGYTPSNFLSRNEKMALEGIAFY